MTEILSIQEVLDFLIKEEQTYRDLFGQTESRSSTSRETLITDTEQIISHEEQKNMTFMSKGKKNQLVITFQLVLDRISSVKSNLNDCKTYKTGSTQIQCFISLPVISLSRQ